MTQAVKQDKKNYNKTITNTKKQPPAFEGRGLVFEAMLGL
jgi:hypothetical protein